MRHSLFSDSIPLPKASGIYSIINRNNLKIYIGSAVNLAARKRVHKDDFIRQRHCNRYFQRAVNKFPDEFEFSIIEVVSDNSKLIEREQFWINFYQSFIPENGYNINPNAASRLGSKQGPFSPDRKLKQSEALKRAYKEGNRIHHNKGRTLPQWHRDAISKANKGRQFTLGRKMPEEEKARRSLLLKGRIFTPEWRAKISAANKGRKPSPLAIKNSVRTRKIKAGLLPKP
jgi:group I intron endonuclease